MILHKKTKTVFCGPVRGKAEVYAADNARTGNGGDLHPQAARFIVSGIVTPSLTLTLPGVGELHLSPGEVLAIRNALDQCTHQSQYPANYCNGRSCVKSI